MVKSDLHEFTALLDGVCSLLTRGQYTPNEMATSIFFRSLQDHPMPAVRAAFEAHVTESKFSPTPAEILAHIRAVHDDDGRLGPEEAWSLALTARDERVTVVWTQEIAQAWDIARHVLPDEVGARMAFKEAYNRAVAAARADGSALVWQAALGHDAAERAQALHRAAEQGRVVDGADAVLALPAPRADAALLLPPAFGDGGVPTAAQHALQRLRDRLAAPPPETSADAEDRERTAQLQRLAMERVARYGCGLIREQQQGGQA